PGTRKRLDIIGGRAEGLVELAPNLWNLYPDCLVESINWLDNRWVFDQLNKVNNRRFAHSIQRALKQLDFDDFYLFNDNEIIKCHYLVDLLRPKVSIYYSRDYIISTPYWKKHGPWLEPRVMAMNDICVADRKSTRLNSSHVKISYAVFCLKKKNATSARHSKG